ncbi:fumarylacetoacetate hydrolase family protein [Saccharopolyspora sp. 5N708]|uniref:fumarylacetoacetate hydrolase family protein n=1 Tax=Saccharopolyspora sp. 5N708 TaxID=3457424 RepID=UPI003FCF94E8
MPSRFPFEPLTLGAGQATENLGGRVRIGVIEGRAVFVAGDSFADVGEVSGGAVRADARVMFEQWNEIVDVHRRCVRGDFRELGGSVLENPLQAPRQVFAVGANYRRHIEEAGAHLPERPLVFTKFPSCLTGPTSPVELSSENVDWEVELVAVVGARADHVPPGRGWEYVSALTGGQDITDRVMQFDGGYPQFSLSKSLRTFGPVGPVLVTPDEFENPDDLALGCALNGRTQQAARTSDLVFSVPVLVEYLSSLCTLYPGDVIFTGTPSGVGAFMNPPRFLRPGDELISWVEGIGQLENRAVPVSVQAATTVPAVGGVWAGIGS